MRGLCFRGEVATGGWGLERADEGRKMQVSSSIPWQLLGVAGGQNKSVLVLEPVESQGGRMVAWKRGTSTCRLIRSLKDYVLCRHSFGAPAESGQISTGLSLYSRILQIEIIGIWYTYYTQIRTIVNLIPFVR